MRDSYCSSSSRKTVQSGVLARSSRTLSGSVPEVGGRSPSCGARRPSPERDGLKNLIRLHRPCRPRDTRSACAWNQQPSDRLTPDLGRHQSPSVPRHFRSSHTDRSLSKRQRQSSFQSRRDRQSTAARITLMLDTTRATTHPVTLLSDRIGPDGRTDTYDACGRHEPHSHRLDARSRRVSRQNPARSAPSNPSQLSSGPNPMSPIPFGGRAFTPIGERSR